MSGQVSPSKLTALLGASTDIERVEPPAWEQHKNWLKNADRSQDIQLKRTLAFGAIWLMAAQIIIADIVFLLYAWMGVSWDLPPEVILGWMGATVVQVIGVVLTISAYLFPKRVRKSAR